MEVLKDVVAIQNVDILKNSFKGFEFYEEILIW
jgi:hypothetical protein